MVRRHFQTIQFPRRLWVSSTVAAIAYSFLATAPVFRWDTAYLPRSISDRRTLPPSLTITPLQPEARLPRPVLDPNSAAAQEDTQSPPGEDVPDTVGSASANADDPGTAASSAAATSPTDQIPVSQPPAATARSTAPDPPQPNLQALTTPQPTRPHTPLPEAGLASISAGLGDRLALLPPTTWVPRRLQLPESSGPAIAQAPRTPGGSGAPSLSQTPPSIARPPSSLSPGPTIPDGQPPAIATVPPSESAVPSRPGTAPAPTTPALPTGPPPTVPPRPSQPSIPTPSPIPAPNIPSVPPPNSGLDGGAAPTTPPEDQSPAPEPSGIFVEQFQIVGSTVFNQQQLAIAVLNAVGLELDAVRQATTVTGEDAAPTVVVTVGRNLTLAQLVQTADAITQLYVDDGYVSSGAIVLEQSATTGQPVIQIIEGQLEDTLVTITAPEPSLTLQRIPESVRSPEPIPWQPLGEPDSELPQVADSDLVAVDLDLLAADSRAARLGGELSITLADTVRATPYDALAAPPGETPPTQAVPVPEIPQVAGSQLDPQTEQWRQWFRPEVATRWLELTGLNPLDPGYVGARLEIASGNPLNVNDLVEGVQLLQIDPLIERIATDISAGSRTGTSRLQVVATQADSDQFQFSYDNSRSLTTGPNRQGVQFSQGNLFGWGDRLQLSYGRTQGSEDWDVFYELPISPYNTTVSVNVGRTASEIIEEIFSQLDLVSQVDYVNLGIRQPIIQTPLNELALSLTLSHTVTRSTFLGGVAFPTDGADDEGFTRITALRFGQEWLQRGDAQVIALQSEFSLGLDTLGATINDEPPDSRFVSWQGRAQWARLLAPDFLFLVRGSLQLADRPLPPIEQLSTGGVSTVRGYRQNTLVTDSGWSASAELQIPVVRIPEIEGLFQVAPFFDAGGGWFHPLSDNDPPEVATLSSIGLGLIWSQGDYLRARLDWGIPLSPVERTGTSLQESGLHFSIILTPP
jgi:hemolysin activation/secretion protein